MKKQLIICLVLLIPVGVLSQNRELIISASNEWIYNRNDTTATTSMYNIRRNSIYNEDFFIFGYERLIPVDQKVGIALKGGILIFDPFMLVTEVTSVFGGTKHFFEAGMGGIIDPFDDAHFATLRAGYRYQAPKGFLFKSSLIYSPDNFILPLITFGYAF